MNPHRVGTGVLTRSLGALAAAIVLALAPMVSWATVTFTATGDPDVSGFVEFDDSSFDGTDFQFVLNTEITGLSLTAFGAVFTLGDVVTTDETIIDSTGIVPVIVNGAGLLANNGTEAIAFFPDGFDGTATDGDASLAFSETPTFGAFTFHAVKWEVVGAVPEPASLLLLALGLAGLGFANRRAH